MAVWAIDPKVQIMIDINKKIHDYATASLAYTHIYYCKSRKLRFWLWRQLYVSLGSKVIKILSKIRGNNI